VSCFYEFGLLETKFSYEELKQKSLLKDETDIYEDADEFSRDIRKKSDD
jgi:hypothetical protein